MAQWNIKIESAESFGSSRHPVIEALLRDRNIVSEEDVERFFSPDYDRDLFDPFLFRSMRMVVDRVKQAKEKDEKIGIFGDYDVDGVTSSVLLRTALERIGLETTVYIPHKETEGHGLHVNAIDAFERAGATLAFTVDCGMTNREEIADAKKRGIDFIVIDHHHVPEILPDAYAIVNPKLPDAGYPFRELCGAGTTFKVIQALYREFLSDEVSQLKWMLDLVAVGTVADVMPLVGENRMIVSYGLIVLSKTRRIGFQEIFSVGNLGIDEYRRPNARAIGFQIGPRINAAGRMAHAKLAHDLLFETDRDRARELAETIESLNKDRRKMSDRIADLVRVQAVAQKERKCVIAAHPEYAFGVVGLVAGRIANEFGKPAVVLEQLSEKSRGSLRSVPGLNIMEALEACSDLLEKFGGHSQAAGLTIRNDRFAEFEERFSSFVGEVLKNTKPEPMLNIDLRILPSHLTLDLLSDLKRFEPFGEGNREPVFLLEHMRIGDIRLVGNGNKHLKLTLFPEGGTKPYDAIGFSFGEKFPDLNEGDHIDVVFTLEENVWNGRMSIQLKLVDLKRR